MSESQAKIQFLSPIVAERIAAGEVIERPASVVKELVENSIDAQSTEISVRLEQGGKVLIEVTDNGIGMNETDLSICVKRHATSKLKSLEDLDRLQTLGFRGEALPSISAVGTLSILTRALDSETTLAWRDERITPVTFGHFLGTPHGTRMVVEGLFAQIPARLKFLKSQASEVAQVREWIERLAIAHPQIGFKLASDERVILNLRPKSEELRVQEILAEGEDFPLKSAASDQSYQGFSVRLHWIQGLSTHSSKRIIQIVNGRAVKDRLLQQAMSLPFKQSYLPGQFPALALFMEINPAEVDVNVHPTKTELRFVDTKKIFSAIQFLSQSLIDKNGVMGFASGTTSLDTYPLSLSGVERTPGFSPPSREFTSSGFYQAREASQSNFTIPSNSAGNPFLNENLPTLGKFAGNLFNTYLLFDQGHDLALIDQHAAHERIRYESLKHRVFRNSALTLTTQSLLIPEAIRFASEKRADLEPKLHLLFALGFEVEIFGEDTLLFRAVPAEWGMDSLKLRLTNLVERTLEIEPGADQELLLDENLFEKLASEACHSAIRAGDALEPSEAENLTKELFRCEHPWNCPHGRPTLVRVPKARFEEWFQRRV